MIRTLVDLLGTFYASNDLSNFEVIARSIYSSVPGETVSLQFLGLAYQRTGRINDAINLFNKAVRQPKPLAPLIPEIQNINVDTSFAEATKNNSNLAQVLYDLGTALQNTGNNEEAIRAFQIAIKTQPQFPDAILPSGELALAIGKPILAKECFSRLRSMQPNNKKAYLGLGMAYRKLRDFATAHACFIRVRLILSGSLGIKCLKNRRSSPLNGQRTIKFVTAKLTLKVFTQEDWPFPLDSKTCP